MRRRAPALLAVLVVALAGCGGDDGAGKPSAAASTATATTTVADATITTPALSGRDRISGCLTGLGYRLTGGAAPSSSSTDAAEYQIVFEGKHGGGYIGFYRNTSRAQRVVKQLRKNATHVSGAAAERHGAVNIVWVDLPDKAARASVRACLAD